MATCAKALSLTMIVSFVAASAGPPVRADDGAKPIIVLPEKLTLNGPNDRHRVLVERVEDGRYRGEAASESQIVSSDPKVVRVEDGVVRPRANGQATVTATVGGETASAVVTVVGYDEVSPWSFRHHVEPILAKYGCSTGACHGALAGKGGFKLSLRGYDPIADFHTITRQARGRRIELSDPGRSLLLAKPSGAIRHKGGLRFDVDSEEYRVLSEWIASGAPGPRADDPRLDHLEVLPAAMRLLPSEPQSVIVRAYYSDGRVVDVSRWAKYTSTNEAVAKVDDQGRISVVGNGEGAITAWFSSQIAIARVMSPYPYEVPAEVFARAPRRNFIDQLVLTKLADLNLRPSPAASDHEFLRRAFLDTIGVLPTIAETQEFLVDPSSDKRDRLIESLLSRTEFVDYWTYKWSDVLLVNSRLLRPEAVKAYYLWIRNHVAANTPWDQFVRAILTATGDNLENGATNFYALHQDPETMSENACQAFLSLSIGCAKCHNHPLEKWTNDQYYAMANLFARVRAKGWGGDPRGGDGRRTLYVATSGELIQPLKGKPQPPTPLDGDAVPFASTEDRRLHLARWLTAPDNPYFSRAIANRIWANFFGAGLVEPVDDLRISNPASNDALLTETARYLVEHDYDVKSLMRVILQSETYQRSSLPLAENRDDQRFYARYYPRRLMAEVMLDAISQVTGVPTEFTELRQIADFKQKTDEYPRGTRALQLYDSAVASYFLEAFGRNERVITCECERTDQPSMVQVLHLSNGDTINSKLQAADGRVAEWLEAGLTDEQIIDHAYVAALARYPTDLERRRLLDELSAVEDGQRRAAIEDLFWGILSSREFLFNH